MSDCLVMLTKLFPFEKGEEFIENEVHMLAKAYDKIIIIATSTPDSPARTRIVPKNAEVFSIHASAIKRKLPFSALKLFPFTGFKDYCDKDEKLTIKHSLKRKAFLTYFITKSQLVYQEALKILARLEIDKYERVSLYSYWFYDTALAVAKLKGSLKAPAVKAVSRAHGYDLYPYRNTMNYLPLRSYILKQIDAVYPCSENGKNYLKEHYSLYSDKIQTAYLGTMDYGLAPQSGGEPFHIVSCCHISPVKRVELLAQALNVLKGSGLPLKWTHFGGGEGLEELQKFARDSLSFMECHFAGEIQNIELMEYYQKNPVDLFINTSSSEGLPVSIMEACSFGIPTIATNVGGTGEIVLNGQTGILLNADFNPEELAEKIKSYLQLPESLKNKFRQNCRTKWSNDFNAIKNFTDFAEKIKPNKEAGN